MKEFLLSKNFPDYGKGSIEVVIMNLYVPTNVIVLIVAIFLFSCGFVAGYCFGSIAYVPRSAKSRGQKA
jgi:hypothetical protein